LYNRIQKQANAFFKSVSYEELTNMTKNIYECWFKFLTCENYLYIEGGKKQKCM
jgi:hypothetical protein